MLLFHLVLLIFFEILTFDFIKKLVRYIFGFVFLPPINLRVYEDKMLSDLLILPSACINTWHRVGTQDVLVFGERTNK